MGLYGTNIEGNPMGKGIIEIFVCLIVEPLGGIT